jgi:hypothetical protein
MNKLILGGAGLVILLLGVFLPVGKESRTVVERVSENLGAVNSPFLAIGAFDLYAQGTASFTQATSSVICSLQSPAGTSTLLHGGVQLTSATSTLTSLAITKAVGAGQIGTVIASTTVTSGTQRTLIAATSTYNAQAVADMVFAPNTYFNVSQQGGGLINATGKCEAIWHVL